MKTKSLQLFKYLLVVAAIICPLCLFAQHKVPPKYSSQPRMVNIVNFIRLLEPRDPKVTGDVLYQTVVKQVAIMKKYHLGGTFLLQYDALLDPRYQKLLKALPRDQFEIGAWWEIPQPLVEHAGLKWRGRYPWDWRANIGFSTGYTPHEREMLADVYMRDFKKIFGYYPRSVASWFIDAHTLAYMYKKYRIVASANCKDQYGTDGYTLWGGYWNQAYYPSKLNAYMPAQHAANQVPVPIFRMLGSDPVRQYNNGLGNNRQGVVTLEPVYAFGGGDSTWVHWFFEQFVDGEPLAFAYTQVGQENSFTWDAMAKGFELQMPLIARLRDEHKIRLETLAASGAWFKQHYKLTPATAVTIKSDIPGSDKKTVWFDSRFYRANLLWENGTLKFRDIHLFNENFASAYETSVATSNECTFFTLPVVDGYVWSGNGKLATLQFKAVINGQETDLSGGDPVITSNAPGKLHITWPLKHGYGKLLIDMDERQISLEAEGGKPINWLLALTVPGQAKLPFTNISIKRISCNFQGMNYSLNAVKGTFAPADSTAVFKILPEKGMVVLRMNQD